MAIAISLTVLPDDQEQAVRVVEVLARSASGLAFDGLTVNLSLTTYEADET